MSTNPTNPWDKDKLDREEDGKHLIRLLRERYEARAKTGDVASYILNLDAAWGEGKTFFIQAIAQDLSAQGHLVAYVNAWQDDLSSDPLTTVMAAMNAAISPQIEKDSPASRAFEKAKGQLGIVAAEASKQLAVHLLKLATGISIDKISNALQADNTNISPEVSSISEVGEDIVEKVTEKAADTLINQRLAAHEKATKSIEEFRGKFAETLKKIHEEKSLPLPLFVFVDELDRCRPTYAIKLLEEIKHLFQIDGIVFVVSTDNDQLCHSIKAIYGLEFDGKKYLRKFFDRTFIFRPSDRRKFIEHIFSHRGINIDDIFWTTPANFPPILVLTSWADHFRLSQRDLVQCAEIIITAYTSWPYPIKFEPVRFLAIVWAIFSGKPSDAAAVDKGINESTSAELSNWKITTYIHDRQTGELAPKNHSAKSYINTFSQIMNKSLSSFLYGRDANDWRNFFALEYDEIFQKNAKELPHDYKSVSIFYKDMIVAAGHSI
ncbi:P-loop NTPase fold protein [Sphingobium sp. WW5]|uniref:KAP family P-loop NTPase fold protein n=1 Tax=unclassified Sphingobium TaxID=2611147 RepID=UPI003C2922A4